MKSKLKLSLIGVILIGIGVLIAIPIMVSQFESIVVIQDNQESQEIQAIQDNQELTTNEKHYAIEQLTTKEVVEENETPLPVSETPEKLEEMKQVKLSPEYEALLEDKRRVLEERLGNSFAAKKLDIDSSFTCENYNELAYKYRGQAFAGFTINGKYDGTFEGYIYWKAFNECIDPNYSANYDKVFQDLAEVYD